MLHAGSTDATDTNSRPEGYTPRLLPPTSAALLALSFPFPYSMSTSSLPSSSASTATPQSLESTYAEIAELHEMVHSLRTQLTAVTSEVNEWRQKAPGTEERVREMAEELSALRLMCGNEDEVQRWRAEQQRRVRNEMREWRRQQEEQLARQASEREKAAVKRKAEDERREAQRAADAMQHVHRSLGLARELQSLWQAAAGDGSALHHRAVQESASVVDATATLHSELSAFHQEVLDNRARQMLDQSSAQCTIQ